MRKIETSRAAPFMVVGCTLLNALAQFFLKESSKMLGISTLFNYNFYLGLTLYALSAFLLIWALKFGEVTRLYPIISFSYVWVTIISIFWLGEEISVKQLLGTGIILSGVFFITGGSK